MGQKQGVGLLVHRTVGLLAVGLKNVGLLSNPRMDDSPGLPVLTALCL